MPYSPPSLPLKEIESEWEGTGGEKGRKGRETGMGGDAKQGEWAVGRILCCA